MPSITINEKDLTTGGGSANSLDVVFIPGFTTTGTTEAEWDKDSNGTIITSNFPGKGVPTLCKTLTEFKQRFGKVPAKIKDMDSEGKVFEVLDKSYIYASKLVSDGIPVLYESVNELQDKDLSVSGMLSALTSIYDESSEDFGNLRDKGEYSFKYLTSGGYPSFQVKLLQNVIISKCVKEWKVDGDEASNSLNSIDECLYSEYEDHLDYVYVLTYDAKKSEWVPSEKNGKITSFATNVSLKSINGPESTDFYGINDGAGHTLVDCSSLSLPKPSNGYYFEISVSSFIDKDNEAQPRVTYKYFTITETSADTPNNNVATAMLKLASDRGDCVAIIDHPDDTTASLTGSGSFYEEFVTFGKGSAYSDYGTAFTPWVNIDYVTYEEDSTTGVKKVVGSYVSMPPSFGYLAALANSIKTNASWLAVAGASRGQIPGLYTEKPFNLSKKITNAIAESGYQNRDSVSINAITEIKPFGYRIWGNRTLKHNSATGEANLTATSFLNIRNMVSDIKQVVYAACKKYTFEQNNDVLWLNFKAAIEPTLNQMKTGAGLSGYKIVKGTTTEKAKLVATIKLYPLYAVEDFEITVEMLDDEVSVS